jgi:4,5-DOPA dioxygenase extradiol
MFITLGAATRADARITPAIDGYWMGLARTSFQVA